MHVQLHGKEQRLQLPVRPPNVAYRFKSSRTVVRLGVWNELNPIAHQNHPTEIFPVIVSPKTYIPRSRSRRKLPADKPTVSLHVQVLSHLPQHPFQRCEIIPESRWREIGVSFSINEVCPGAGK